MGKGLSGFAFVDALIGLGIVMLVVAASTAIFRPLSQSFKKTKQLAQMQKIESTIRDEIFNQKSYTDLDSIEIKLGDVVVAKQSSTLYVKEDLSESSPNPIFPLKVNFEVASFAQTGTGEARVGGIYQIQSTDESLKMHPLGIRRWPQMPTSQFLRDEFNESLSNPDSHALLIAPKRFTSSIRQLCGNGFIRGLKGDNSGTVICWSLGNTKCPAWSLPIGIKFDSTTNLVSVVCQKLNKVTCNPLTLSLQDSTTMSLDDFQTLSLLDYRDLYPPVAASRNALSQCKPVINFNAYDLVNEPIPGKISSEKVQELSPATLGAVCPQETLYNKEADGSCTPRFLSSIPESSNSIVSPPEEATP
jgi:hypothetical protein